MIYDDLFELKDIDLEFGFLLNRNLVNNWSITPINANRSRIDMRLEMKLLPVFNLVMAPMMKMQMGKVAKESIEELKYFVETGKPHPRKLEMSTK